MLTSLALSASPHTHTPRKECTHSRSNRIVEICQNPGNYASCIACGSLPTRVHMSEANLPHALRVSPPPLSSLTSPNPALRSDSLFFLFALPELTSCHLLAFLSDLFAHFFVGGVLVCEALLRLRWPRLRAGEEVVLSWKRLDGLAVGRRGDVHGWVGGRTFVR